MAGINLDVSGLKVLLEPVSAQTFSLTVPSAVPAVVEVLATGPQGPTGSQGPIGPTGVVTATAPITYDSGTQTVGIDAGGFVASVNGETGTVVLDAGDVGAYAADNPSGFVDAAGAAAAAPVQSVNSLSGTVVLDSEDVGAIGTATGLYVYDYGTAVPDTRPEGLAVYWQGTAVPGTAISRAGDLWYDSTGD